jgi:hypothetical protein
MDDRMIRDNNLFLSDPPREKSFFKIASCFSVVIFSSPPTFPTSTTKSSMVKPSLMRAFACPKYTWKISWSWAEGRPIVNSILMPWVAEGIQKKNRKTSRSIFIIPHVEMRRVYYHKRNRHQWRVDADDLSRSLEEAAEMIRPFFPEEKRRRSLGPAKRPDIADSLTTLTNLSLSS